MFRRGRWRRGDVPEGVPDQTAWSVALSTAKERLRAERDRLEAHSRALDDELGAARERLTHVRDLERRRIVGTLNAVTTREFADLRLLWREVDDAATANVHIGPAMARFRRALDEVIDRFRTTVRGVHPAMLPEVGPKVALEELAADLPRAVRFHGDLGRRVGWEIESGVYHAAAAVLALLSESGAPEPVVVDLVRAEGELRITITDPAWTRPMAELQAVLADDAGRLAAFGGRLEPLRDKDGALVRVILPERFDGAVASSVDSVGARDAGEPGTLPDRLRALVAAAPRNAEWAAVAAILDRPPTVAVVGTTGTAAVVRALIGIDVAGSGILTWYVHGRARDVTVHRPNAAPTTKPITVAGLDCPPDTERLVVRWPAELLLTMTVVDVPVPADLTQFDVVVQLGSDDASADRDFRRALRAAPGHRDVIAFDGAAGDLAAILGRRVTGRSDLIVARTALAAAGRLLVGAAPGDPLARLLDRIRADTHELAELDLLDQLDGGVVVLHGDRDAAERLLGAYGRDAPTRLGLPATAARAQIRAAARDAAARWRQRAERPATGHRERAAYQTLVRTCEGLSHRET